MSHFLNFLWLVTISMIGRIQIKAHPIAGRSNAYNNSEEYGYYNIYSKIDALEERFQNLKASVKTRFQLLQQVFLAVTEIDDNTGLLEGDQELVSIILQRLKNNENLTSTKDTAIGFTTKLTRTTYSSSSSIIEGSPILYNGGNAYNGTAFTCPSPGLYLFHVSLLTDTGNRGIWIYKNLEQLTIAWPGNRDPHWNGGSVSAVVWLDVGDHVYLRPSGTSLSVGGNSAFTGVKVN